MFSRFGDNDWRHWQFSHCLNANIYLTKELIMANNVTVTELGGAAQVISDVSTVQDIADQLDIDSGLEVSINGKSATYESTVSDYNFVSFGKKVKGGNL